MRCEEMRSRRATPRASMLQAAVLLILLLGAAAEPRLHSGRGVAPALEILKAPAAEAAPTGQSGLRRKGARDCQERWHNMTLDHFRHQCPAANQTSSFPLRYLIYDEYWDWFDTHKGPIFFYAGHQHDVRLYADNIGFMWENARTFHAMLVFAEHRYYGKSQPFGPGSVHTDPQFLTAEQAIADYVELLLHLRTRHAASDSPVIVFGSSYGGMIASLLRLKYPHIVKAAVSSSAPVGAFPAGLSPPYDPSSYWQAVTFSAGAHPHCIDNVSAAFSHLLNEARSSNGRTALSEGFMLCSPLENEEDGMRLAYWVQTAFDTFARGNYPYTSSFAMGSLPGSLPAWPMQAACRKFGAGEDRSEAHLRKALKEAVDMLYNATGERKCHDLSARSTDSLAGDYQWCTQLISAGQAAGKFPASGSLDMFWDQGELDLDLVEQRCAEEWGSIPDRTWAAATFGGLHIGQHASNIVFTNGEFDPWATGGVMQSMAKRSVVALMVMKGAHASDLMYSSDKDPASFLGVRALEQAYIWKWLQEEYDEHRYKQMVEEGIEELAESWAQLSRKFHHINAQQGARRNRFSISQKLLEI